MFNIWAIAISVVTPYIEARKTLMKTAIVCDLYGMLG